MHILLIIAFLSLTVGVTCRSTKQTTTFRSYMIGNKQLPTGYLVATLVTTIWSAATLIYSVACIHCFGLCMIFLLITCIIIPLVISKLSLNMSPFMTHLSMPETIGTIYGKLPRLVVAFVSLVSYSFLIARQIYSISYILNMYMDKDYALFLTILTVLTLMLYATLRNMDTITATDIMQIATFCITLPMLYLWMYRQTGKSTSEIFMFLQTQEKFQFSSLFHSPTQLWSMVAVMLANIFAGIDVVYMQKVYMSSNLIQASNVFKISSIVNLCIVGCLICIGLCTFTLAPTLLFHEVWPYIIHILPPILKGFLLISILAMAISTVDSILNSSALIFTHDIIAVLMRKQIATKHQIQLVRCTMFVIMIVSLTIIFFCNKLNLCKLMRLHWNTFVPVALAPFILAIFGFRGSSLTAIIGMITGIVSIIVWNQWIRPITNTDGSFMCMLANGLAMMVTHHTQWIWKIRKV